MSGHASASPHPPPARERRPRTRVLLGFLAAFVGLIVLFRAVLFPFLMAMFLAYLVEPVVGWISRRRRLGVQVSRGPALIGLYVLALGLVGVLGFLAVHRIDTVLRTAATSLRAEFARTAEKARFVVAKDGSPQPPSSPIDVPKGTRIVYQPVPDSATGPLGAPGVYRTTHYVRIDTDEPADEVLLEPTNEPVPEGLKPPAFLDRGAVRAPEGFEVSVEPLAHAKGLEVFLERHVLAPVSAQVERATGEPFDPGILRRALTTESEDVSARIRQWLVAGGGGVFGGIVGSVYTFVLILMLAAFMVVDRARIAGFFASLPPPHLRPQYDRLIGYVDRGLAGVIRGQLVICAVNGLLTWVGLLVIGVKYAEILALVAGTFSLIPVFGTIASSVPIVLVAVATGGFATGGWALGWICVIHLLEANLFNPLIMGSNAEMHPIVIVFALLAGEHTFGLWGALLAVPTASILQSCFKYYRHEIEGVPEESPPAHGGGLRALFARRKAKAAEAAPPTPAPGGPP